MCTFNGNLFRLLCVSAFASAFCSAAARRPSLFYYTNTTMLLTESRCASAAAAAGIGAIVPRERDSVDKSVIKLLI